MESPKKQTPQSWDEIVRGSREESPAEIDVRPLVRARLESELRLGSYANFGAPIGLLDGVLELFSRKVARLSLIACFGAAAVVAVVSTSVVDVSELSENELDAMEDFGDALMGEDLALYL